jgi:hypothetical protein
VVRGRSKAGNALLSEGMWITLKIDLPPKLINFQKPVHRAAVAGFALIWTISSQISRPRRAFVPLQQREREAFGLPE